MSIEKLEFHKVTKENIPYTLINTKVIQQIKDKDVLAVWVYLCSLPPDWRVCKEQLMKHFKIGERKIKQIFSYLKKTNLIEYSQQRKAYGNYGDFTIHVLCGDKFIDITGGADSALPAGGAFAARAVNRTCGNGGLQNTIKQQSSTSSTKSTKKLLDKNEKSKSVDNSKRHPFADSMDQEACFKKHLKSHEEIKAEEMKMKRTNGIVKL